MREKYNISHVYTNNRTIFHTKVENAQTRSYIFMATGKH